MPPIIVQRGTLRPFGLQWSINKNLSRTPPYNSSQLGDVFDQAISNSLATMLGGIPIVKTTNDSLSPPQPLCVEYGDVRVVGGVRPQNFDVVFRPDGPRFVHDSKTLNDKKSVPKNWQNMINDISTEATTVHTRFPYAVTSFMVVTPLPCVQGTNQLGGIIAILERLTKRVSFQDPPHLAEVISFVVWNPRNGVISTTIPETSSPLRIEKYSSYVQLAYFNRYKGLPPHN
jgi:hypothetical protein